jgi:DNA-binding HxlR family transcriptional regulator
MLNREYQGQNCSIAGALEIVGERWTLLIVRDALLGLRRFEEFQESLGIARNVLTDRLHWLVSQDILEAVPYGPRPDRYEYRLTAKGRDLFLALTALRQWGDTYLTDQPSALLRRKSDQGPVVVALVTNSGEAVQTGEVELVAGPGRDPACATWRLADRADPYSAEPGRSGPEPDGVPGQHSSSGRMSGRMAK